MAGDANIRASDADRDRVVAALREHLAAGRLTTEEFSDRLDLAFAAKTLGDLDSLMADLPGADLGLIGERPAAPGPAAGPLDERLGEFSPAWRAVWRPWIAVTLFFFVLWLVTGAAGGPWFVYPALVAGLLLLRRARHPARRHDPRHDREQLPTHRDQGQLGR
jgi:uncharacterized membrane protein YccC